MSGCCSPGWGGERWKQNVWSKTSISLSQKVLETEITCLIEVSSWLYPLFSQSKKWKIVESRNQLKLSLALEYIDFFVFIFQRTVYEQKERHSLWTPTLHMVLCLGLNIIYLLMALWRRIMEMTIFPRIPAFKSQFLNL